MGIRQNQVFGLNEAARTLLASEHLIPYENGQSFEGYFDERFPLHNWAQPTPEMNRVSAEILRLEISLSQAEQRRALLARSASTRYVEYVQEVVYSSGPCIFLALRDGNGKPVQTTLWPQSEIDGA